jgi:hypothetical protein
MPDFWLIAWTVDTTVSIANVLTIATVLVSVVTLATAWRKDRLTRQREIADRVRSAAAVTLAKLERWDELARWFYRDVQPEFLEVTTSLADEFDVAAARDLLWAKLMTARIGSAERILKEEIENAYVDLYAYEPAVYEPFTTTMAQLRRIDNEVYEQFLETAQSVVLAYGDQQRDEFRPAELGNDLRAVAIEAQRRLVTRMSAALGPVRGFLLMVVSQPDAVLVRRSLALPVPAPDEIVTAASSIT